MIVTLLEEEGLSSLLLPARVKGKYWVQSYEKDSRLIAIEGMCNRWRLRSNEKIQILNRAGGNIISVTLSPCNLYSIRNNETGKISYLFTEPVTEDWKQYVRYTINGKNDIYIGRSAGNSICINNIAISSVHARLSRQGNTWVLYDENSTNGIYVNRHRIHGNCMLKPGDVLYIMGFRMIIGKGFLAMNHPNHSVTLEKNIFSVFKRRNVISNGAEEEVKTEYFERSFRTTKTDSYFTIKQCEEMILAEKSCLWERKKQDEDFLKLRVGKENIVFDFKAHPVVGVTGNMEDKVAFAKGLLMQMLAYYGYDTFKIIFLLDEETQMEFQMVRWLPHVWDDKKRFRLIATNQQEGEQLVDYLEQEGKKRQQLKKTQGETGFPYYMVFAFHHELANQMNLSGLLETGFIYFSDHKSNLPHECMEIIDIREDRGCIIKQKTGTKRYFTPDIYVRKSIDLSYLQLANMQLDLGSENNKSAMWYMVELYLPAVGKSYDVRIPRNRRIGEIIPMLETDMKEKTAETFCTEDAVLCEREYGIMLDVDATPEETGILNGTRLMLI